MWGIISSNPSSSFTILMGSKTTKTNSSLGILSYILQKATWQIKSDIR